MVPCIRHDRDCANSCRLTAAFLARPPPVMRERIESCRKCHDECAPHPHAHYQECPDACRAYKG